MERQKTIDIIGKNGKNVKESLEESRDEFEYRSKAHKKNEKIFKCINCCLTYPTFILSIVITSVAGIKNFTEVSEDKTTLTLFILGLISSILSGTNTFFNLSQKVSKYHIVSMHYQNLYIDLKTWLLWARERDELASKLQQVKISEQTITDYESGLIF